MNGLKNVLENPITEVADKVLLNTVPLVSVVMITYNHEKYLAQAIDSVLAQVTEFRVELIIGEDCSTDSTRSVALEYQRKFPSFIRVRFPERNLGPALNFIATLNAARGQYIALCEGDDYWCDAEKLKNQVAILKIYPGYAGVFHECHQLQQKTGSQLLRINQQSIDETPNTESIIRKMNIPTASMLFKRFLLTDRHKNLLLSTRKGDYMMSLIVSEQGIWKYLPNAMSVYRIHDGGVWSGDKAINIAKADIDFYKLLLKDPIYSINFRLIKQKRKNSIRQLAEEYAKERKFARSIFFFISSIGSRSQMSGQFKTTVKYFEVLFRELGVGIYYLQKVRKFVTKAK